MAVSESQRTSIKKATRPGTTFDAFQQLYEAKKYGARVALYGRMINNSEHQPTFVRHLRAVADDQIEPAEAVRSYHGELDKLGLRPYRPIEDDLQATQRAGAYSGSGQTISTGASTPSPSTDGQSCTDNGEEPDFSKMTLQEKIDWNRRRWKRILG